QIVRRVVIQSYAIPRAEGSIAGWWLVAFILGLLSLGLLLSLIGRRRSAGPHDSSDMPAGECA
ncbi:MAG TPA: hypothetical protein VK472_01700, partial [Allosphingosinicella sp.]|nr:hypothetical protein [Allosphingosinicella sp.]